MYKPVRNSTIWALAFNTKVGGGLLKVGRNSLGKKTCRRGSYLLNLKL
jgi:hypothetical protein